ncbi:hypothetical protein [Deinococcus pimensis]|uniref:hypothetical protein n=1 Tax=Deinococcus pimensis TaxID=309888 RepID=UPI0004BBEF7D|nr:hypothetical protein [Deinococcus pimensis]
MLNEEGQREHLGAPDVPEDEHDEFTHRGRFFLTGEGLEDPSVGEASAFSAWALEELEQIAGVEYLRELRDQPFELADALSLTPWSRAKYEACADGLFAPDVTPLERARRFVVSWQQFSTRRPEVGTRNGWPSRTPAGPSPTSVWSKLPDRVTAAAARLLQAKLECRPALDVLANVADPHVLVYADPPYLDDGYDAGSAAHPFRSCWGQVQDAQVMVAIVGP